MRLCYVLLSPTWGMHQYTADLANRMAAAGHEVDVVTTRRVPHDRYSPAVTLHTPVSIATTGFSLEGLNPRAPGICKKLQETAVALQPDVVHFTGPHLWNPWLLQSLRQARIPTVHTLHDVHPHTGAVYGRLLYLWNGWVRSRAGDLLVHGQCHRQDLIAQGMDPARVTSTPLTHLFVSHDREQVLQQALPPVTYERWVLLVGRLAAYKGLDVLVEAVWRLEKEASGYPLAVVAGPGSLRGLVRGILPPGLGVVNHLVADEEAIDLFSRCGLVVLPYIEASQSALVAAAYFFHKPVIVTRVGALPEYVVDGETGWSIPPGDPHTLTGALRVALSDPVRLERMGQAGRVWYDRQRQLETAALQELYSRVGSEHA
jgi:glycosyltransferase involved in cell wall biosynthesis